MVEWSSAKRKRRRSTSRGIIALCPFAPSLLPPRPKESRRRRGPRRNFSIGPTKIPFVREHVLSSKNIPFVPLCAPIIHTYVQDGPRIPRAMLYCAGQERHSSMRFPFLSHWIGRLVLFSLRGRTAIHPFANGGLNGKFVKGVGLIFSQRGVGLFLI